MEELAQTNETALPGHRRGDGRGFRVRRDPCARGRWQGQDVGKGREPNRVAWPGAVTTALWVKNPAPRPSFDEVCRLGCIWLDRRYRCKRTSAIHVVDVTRHDAVGDVDGK